MSPVQSLSGVRPLTVEDLEWVLDMGAQRRQRIAGFAPRFWRPAPDARDRHREFLRGQIQDPKVVSLRTGRGFVFAVPRGELLDVDDMAVNDDTCWPFDGARLLRAVLERGELRFVCPVPEPARTQTAVDLGMTLVQSWWHHDLDPESSVVVVDDPGITVGGVSGRLVEAPPVYEPGGLVLLVSVLKNGAATAAIERAAAARGAVVSVVPRAPGEPVDMLVDAGYQRTTDFFTWRR